MRIPPNYPALGADAFRTGTGVHAAAVIKALRKGDRGLADSVYSGVPASVVGREQRIVGRRLAGVGGRARGGHRGRADVRRIERRLLARVARLRADEGARRARVRS